ncbi:hypothetical protein GDO81_027763 [Engystomops pustulosus]|uniref:Peptidase S1 domain-containing protein n=1 Tax=Engystomops pustulosus TaxID=76066 RepID=A0AAV6YJH9_ENGPU|nr:hypothetical protein GDO81_027763 [Engystomops pustulosus]
MSLCDVPAPASSCNIEGDNQYYTSSHHCHHSVWVSVFMDFPNSVHFICNTAGGGIVQPNPVCKLYMEGTGGVDQVSTSE